MAAKRVSLGTRQARQRIPLTAIIACQYLPTVYFYKLIAVKTSSMLLISLRIQTMFLIINIFKNC